MIGINCVCFSLNPYKMKSGGLKSGDLGDCNPFYSRLKKMDSKGIKLQSFAFSMACVSF